jgi:tetratricopeptide (TPR) repeat protein
MDPAARDKVLRSHALSTAAGLTPMRALSAAWLAHLDYARLDVEAMTRHVRQALELANQEQHSIQSRSGLVIAQALHLAGRYDLALPWYNRARRHAIQDGDDATVGAVLHNMAWLHMSTVRQATFVGRVGSSESEHVLTSAESTKNFDELFGVSSLADLEPILRAQVLSLKGRADDALRLYERHLMRAGFRGALRLRANLLADQAWCRAQGGDIARAMDDALEAASSLHAETQVDDLAAAHSRLAQTFLALGQSAIAEMHRDYAAIAWLSFSDLQVRVVELLGQIPDSVLTTV